MRSKKTDKLFHFSWHFITKSKCFYNFFSTIATIDKLGQIANMNKTGFGISKVKKTVSQKARKHSYTRGISTTSHITANICVFASGRVLPSSAMYENCFLIKWNIQRKWTYRMQTVLPESPSFRLFHEYFK